MQGSDSGKLASFSGLPNRLRKNGQNGQEMDMIWGMILRRGTDTLRLKSFYENGQKWTKWTAQLRRGTDTLMLKSFYKNGQKWTRWTTQFRRGMNSLKIIESRVTSCVNRSRHFETSKILRQS